MKRDYHCPQCGSRRLTQIDRYDAMACRACNVWTEPACGDFSDEDCQLCHERPPTPEGVNWNDPNNTEYGL